MTRDGVRDDLLVVLRVLLDMTHPLLLGSFQRRELSCGGCGWERQAQKAFARPSWACLGSFTTSLQCPCQKAPNGQAIPLRE